MNNKDIARKFDLLAKLMELHDENPFKIRSYANAYISLRKLEDPLSDMDEATISTIPGIGSAITGKITELITTGTMSALTKVQSVTPEGVQQLLNIRGLGSKKVAQMWREMEIASPGDLLYACNENRLVKYKGFGLKSQEEIKSKVEYYLESQGWYLYAALDPIAEQLIGNLKAFDSNEIYELSGAIRRRMPELEAIEILSTHELTETWANKVGIIKDETGKWVYEGCPIVWKKADRAAFYNTWYKDSAGEAFLDKYGAIHITAESEKAIFDSQNLPYIVPELREWNRSSDWYQKTMTGLVTVEDIKGIVHNHSTYSDGLHTLQDMSDYVKSSGFDYFVISDHSKTASYAGGLKEQQVIAQWKEIDALNRGYDDEFKVYKSIESDILNDGSLDYEEDILRGFDLVIASVHSVLNMDAERATTRLIKAIEHPRTRILGHPTGRLLLSRMGYPLDYDKIIDACAANHVVIELNANPQRLDIDWKYIPHAIEKGVMIAINPDAHSKASIHYIKYGVAAARKGGLTSEWCLNAKSRSEFNQWLASK